MASIPQGAFATLKVKANASKGGWQKKQDDPKGSWSWGNKKPKEQFNFPQFHQELLEHPPAKYNGKMMNSIWGQYNRYSVHNFKQIAGDAFSCGQQLPCANDMVSGIKSVTACFASPAYMGTKSG